MYLDSSTDGLFFFFFDSVSVRRALLPNPHLRKRTCATVRSAHDRDDLNNNNQLVRRKNMYEFWGTIW